MQIAVLGAGGVGGLIATLLVAAGHDVVVIARPETAKHIEEHGIHLESERFGELRARPKVTDHLDESVEAVVVATKAHDLGSALNRLPASSLKNSAIVPLLNGIEHMGTLRQRYPTTTVIAGAVRVAASRPTPGRILHSGPLASIEVATGAPSLVLALRSTGFDVAVRDSELDLLWDKLCFLAPMSLLTTSAATPLGLVRDKRGDQLLALVNEVAQVAAADGAKPDPAKVWAFMQAAPAGMMSSLQRDVADGRSTELDAIGGAVLRTAARHDIELPVLRRVVDELRLRVLN